MFKATVNVNLSQDKGHGIANPSIFDFVGVIVSGEFNGFNLYASGTKSYVVIFGRETEIPFDIEYTEE